MFGVLPVFLFVFLYTSENEAGKCTVKKVTAANKKDILDAHNNLRSKVAQGKEKPQPKASNMLELEWELGLQKDAEAFAKKCELVHNTAGTGFYKIFGQNLYMSVTMQRKDPPAEYKKAIQLWYDEVTKPGFDPNGVEKLDPNNSPGTGHYTQVVWAESRHVGCARSFKKGQRTEQYIICNYGPPGNFIGHPVYKIGKPCSNCDSKKCSKQYQGLCTYKK